MERNGRKGKGAPARRPRLADCRGFSLIELMIVILLLGVLVGLAVPVFASVRDMAERGVCWHNQRSIAYAIMRWRADHPDEEFITDSCLPGGGEAYIDIKGNVPGDPSRSLAAYFEEGGGPFDCPSNGRGVGEAAGMCDYLTDGYTVTCLTDNQVGVRADGKEFRHDVPRAVTWDHVMRKKEPEKKKTPLGDTFQDITKGMIDLIKEYYQKYKKYPASSGASAYTDIGLDPEDWKLPVDHAYYVPAGSRVKVAPEAGYSFEVTSVKGKKLVLTSKSGGSLIYDVSRGKWYYKTVSTANEIDISSLRVIQE
jgi:type IV pilus assembly protein PilA